MTNKEEKYGFDEVVVLDGTWKEMLLVGMDMVNTKYVMLWMDDYLLCDVGLLKKYIKDYQTPWDFERKGSVEVKDNKHPLLAPSNYTFPYEEGVRRGKWLDNGGRLCKRNNISLDFNKRKQMSSFELAWLYFKGGILEISPTKIAKIQSFFDIIQRYMMDKRKIHKNNF